MRPSAGSSVRQSALKAMATPVRMPALGQTSDELRLIAWLKAEGDVVAEGEPLFEAESDKAVHEVEASADGTLLRVFGELDAMIKVGTVIAWLGEPGDEIPEPPPADPKGGAAPRMETPAPTPPATAAPPTHADDRVAATPVARRMAREHGVDLATVTGTGRNGRIESSDVLAASANRSAPGAVEPPSVMTNPAPDGASDQPVPSYRRAIAERLVRSTSVPQFSVSRTIDARAVLARVAELEGATLTHVLLQAMSAALDNFPRLNRVWIDDEPPRFRQLTQARIGLAIASEDRLVVATISDAHRLPLGELAQAVRETVRQGREGRLSGAAAAPASISLSNLGMYGVDRFDAIVDPDQTAILAVGRVIERPAAIDGELVVLPQMELTLTVDHRTVDGGEAGSYLTAVCGQLEQ